MDKYSVQQLFESFNHLNVLVIGDVMIDSYLFGNVDKISPEAPVPIVNILKKENRLGGAANVALNVKSMGANCILCSLIGDGEKSELLYQLMQKQGLSTEGIVKSKKRIITIKTRIISKDYHHILRIDEEQSDPINELLTEQLFKKIQNIIINHKIDIIIFEDYDKGVITPKLIQKVVDLSIIKQIPTAVDPKKQNFKNYKGVTLFKPNFKELQEGLNIAIKNNNLISLTSASKKIKEILNTEIVLVTLSEYGVFYSTAENQEIISAHRREISDVSGAGDSVIAVASLCLALKVDIKWIAKISNLAGGIVCENSGVFPINKKILEKETQLLL